MTSLLPKQVEEYLRSLSEEQLEKYINASADDNPYKTPDNLILKSVNIENVSCEVPKTGVHRQ